MSYSGNIRIVIFTFCNIHIVKTVLKIETMYRATYMLGSVTNCLFFAFVICEPSTWASENTTDSSEGSSGYEFLNIGGLFSIHGRNGTSRCGAFRIGGFEELNAMLFALNKVNENNSLLPRIKLLAKIEDTCSSVELAAEKSLNFTVVNYQSMYECNSGQSSQGKPILAIVGGRSSDISRAVTSLVGLFHIPVISYGATSTSLSGVKYFTRTVAPATFATQALIDVVRRFGWNYVILLYSNNEYGQFAAGAFRQRLRKDKKPICIAVDEQITEDTNGNVKIWKKIYKQKYKTKVVVIFATYDDFMEFLHSGNDLDQYIWLSDDMWNGQASNLTRMIKYAISVIPRQVYVSEFANFFHNAAKDLSYSKRYSVFDDNWFEEYHVISKPQVFRNISLVDTESSCVSWGSSEVSYVMDAVYTIAWALHGILCNDTTNSCDKSEGMSFVKR